MASWGGRSKGNVFGYLIFIRLIKFFGIRAAYHLLRVVALYYFLFSLSPKRNLKKFYLKIPSLSTGIHELIFKNFIFLGKCLIDRYAFQMGAGSKISYSEEGEKYLKELSQQKQGAVLISGHLGNWDIAANLLKSLDAKLNVVMYDGEAQKLKAFLENTVGKPMFNIIPIRENDLSHIFLIKDALSKGEMICIHGDRYVEGSKTLEMEMFGEKTLLPQGPFQIAALMKVPYAFVYAVKTGTYQYHFSCSEPKISRNPKEIANEYLSTLEVMVQKYPEQWFNYHPFFS